MTGRVLGLNENDGWVPPSSRNDITLGDASRSHVAYAEIGSAGTSDR